jgi:hypothetical protein
MLAPYKEGYWLLEVSIEGETLDDDLAVTTYWLLDQEKE